MKIAIMIAAAPKIISSTTTAAIMMGVEEGDCSTPSAVVDSSVVGFVKLVIMGTAIVVISVPIVADASVAAVDVAPVEVSETYRSDKVKQLL